MTNRLKPLNEVSHQAIQALSERLGVVDTIRFVNQFTIGQGNYTEERDALFGHFDLDVVVAEIESRRNHPERPQFAPPNQSLNPGQPVSASGQPGRSGS